MATPSLLLIEAIRKAAKNLQDGKPYEWGHMGNCNCGHLAQNLLHISKAEIHAYAMQKNGDWNEQLKDYCPTSGLQMDQLIFGLLEKGLGMQDLMQLEYLSNPEILSRLGVTHLKNNDRSAVIKYMQTWADMMEEELMRELPTIAQEASAETTIAV